MTEHEYNQLIRAARDQNAREMQVAEAKLAETLHALRVVWNLSRQECPQSPSTEGRSSEKLINAVRGAIGHVGAEFTVHDISRKIIARVLVPGRQLQQTSISTALRRLVESKEIETVEVGSGKRPSRYRIVGNRATCQNIGQDTGPESQTIGVAERRDS